MTRGRRGAEMREVIVIMHVDSGVELGTPHVRGECSKAFASCDMSLPCIMFTFLHHGRSRFLLYVSIWFMLSTALGR